MCLSVLFAVCTLEIQPFVLKFENISTNSWSNCGKSNAYFSHKLGHSLGEGMCELVFMVIHHLQNKEALKSAVSFQT